jgi:exopolyphosphatase/guanosine-5'-triphosphate,3'-diphosphate pyrophosphatase
VSNNPQSSAGRNRGKRAGVSRFGGRSAQGDARAERGPVFAAIDLGTNNCRLLIARPGGPGGFRVVDSFSRIVRLGEGLRDGGSLQEPATIRTIAALKICARKMKDWRVQRSRAVATAACRHAANGAAFAARVQQETGLELEIITAEEEARLTVASCAPLFDHEHDMALVFDIGGGSTELIWLALEPGGVFRTVHWISVPLGVVSLAESFDGREVTPDSYEAMVAHAKTHIEAAGLPPSLPRAPISWGPRAR